MMFRNGVFVPPSCPTSPRGHLPDLRVAPFAFHIGDRTSDDRGRCTETEIFVVFGEADKHGDYPNSVESASLVVPINSAIAAKARRLVGTSDKDEIVSAAESSRIAKVRDLFCERVAQCRGVTKGECWALNAAAIREVIKKA